MLWSIEHRFSSLVSNQVNTFPNIVDSSHGPCRVQAPFFLPLLLPLLGLHAAALSRLSLLLAAASSCLQEDSPPCKHCKSFSGRASGIESSISPRSTSQSPISPGPIRSDQGLEGQHLFLRRRCADGGCLQRLREGLQEHRLFTPAPVGLGRPAHARVEAKHA